ncbi:MAG: phosphoesterase [Promethearchaeota archaeon]
MNKNQNFEEHVMVFPAYILKEIGYFQGLCFDINKYMNIIKLNYFFTKRRDAETNNSYKQLIPYVILNYSDKIFSYRRGSLLSEERLLNNYSIGIGGHISAIDPNFFTTTYNEGMKREIKEELFIDTKYSDNMVALLNDDSNEVGRVHFGIIHIFKLNNPLVRKNEKSINEPKFLSIKELKKNIKRYENWSKICINNIEKLFEIRNLEQQRKFTEDYQYGQQFIKLNLTRNNK